MQTAIKGYNEAGAEVNLKASAGGLLMNLPYQVVWTQKGYGKQAMATAAIAGLVVRPDTTAAATLHNNTGSGKVLVIERVMVHQLVSTAAQARFGLWLCVHPAGMAAPANDITVRNSTSGKAAGGSNTRFDNGATVVDDGWFPWGDSVDVEPTGLLPGAQISAEIGGRIMIPETAGISAHVVASLVGDTFTIGFHWYEVPASELVLS